MMLAAAVAAAVSAAQPAPGLPAATPPTLADAAQALDAGRVDQARRMIANAISAGAKGVEVDRLLADVAFASGKYEEAVARYSALLEAGVSQATIAERAGIAALKLGRIESAQAFIGKAIRNADAGWRAWNAHGVLADLKGEWDSADAAYDRASALAPGRGEILSNRGWSQLLRGNWDKAIEPLEQAVKASQASQRTANNLELARAAIASELPARAPGESGSEWARRLNDAGLAAKIMGNRMKAIAAFTQALQASGRWYERAANNLEAVTAAR